MQTPQEIRLLVDCNRYIDQAIEMLMHLPEIRKSPYTAGINGVLALLQYAKDSHKNTSEQLEATKCNDRS